MAQKVVLAYSGGLDTTCILFWLKEQGFQVICYTADVGQQEDLEAVREQALLLGAVKAVVDDRLQEFVSEFVWPSLSFGGQYQGRYLLGTALCRPCISRGIVRVAQEEGAAFVAHGATGKGNDQVRFELSCAAIDPRIKFIAPWRMDNFLQRFHGRPDLMRYAQANGFTVTATPDKPFSTDANAMHVSFESGVLEDPAQPPPDHMFLMTADPSHWPDAADDVRITLAHGVPVAVEHLGSGGRVEGAVDILLFLNKLAGKHGIGRIDIVEDRFIGMKSRGVYESPGATVVWTAVRDLELMCLDREVNKIRARLATDFAEKVYFGLWFSPECHYLRACLRLSQKLVSGSVDLRLFKGQVAVRGRRADRSLYDQQLVSMDVEGEYRPADADGFIRTTALRLMAFKSVHEESPFE